MRRVLFPILLVGAGLLLVIWVLVGTQFLGGDSEDAVAGTVPSQDDGPQLLGRVDNAGAVTQGIEVHGDWTIEVFNPDGTLADQRVFTNELEENGAKLLSGILAGNITFSRWYLWVGSAAGEHPCTSDFDGSPLQCQVRQTDAPQSSITNNFYTLTVEGPVDLSEPGTVTMIG